MYEPTLRPGPSLSPSAPCSACFDWREHPNGEVRRIRRQVAEACTNSLDRLLHTSDFVERDVVDHHTVSALERWDQTLLYVSQEGLSIHGSFDPPRIHAPRLAHPSQKHTSPHPPIRARLPNPPLAGSNPSAAPLWVGPASRPINTCGAGQRKPCSRNPASARAGDVGALPLCRAQTFF